MIKLQFKLPQTLISRGFTRRTVLHAPGFQQKGINRLMDIENIKKLKSVHSELNKFVNASIKQLCSSPEFQLEKSINFS